MKEEYLMLREEILNLNTITNNTLTLFYGFIATYFAFAFNKGDSIYMILSYIAIYPIYIIVLINSQGISKIGGYLAVFHENKKNSKFNWETRSLTFYEKNKVKMYRVGSSNMPFLAVSFIVTLYVIYDTYKLMIEGNFKSYGIAKLIISLSLFFIIVLIYINNRNVNTKTFVDKWEKVSIMENPKKHPFGINEEHAHDYIYDEKGNLVERTIRELNDKEKKEMEEIL